MKQRVAIARGMAMEPDILLMDEPFAALDALTRRKMQDELLRLWDETRFTVLFVTHSIPEAMKIGNRILLLSPHPGQVKAELNSIDARRAEPGQARRLSRTHIHKMLFADVVGRGGAASWLTRIAPRGQKSSASRIGCDEFGVVEKPLSTCRAALRTSAGCARP